MEPPKCRLCEKHHYGSCGEAVIPAEPRARKSAKKSAKKSKDKSIRDPGLSLGDRVDELELIVIGLVEGRRKRTEYMKEYMREFRRREK